MLKIQTVAALAALLALPAFADTRIEYVDEKTGEPTSAITIKDGKVRMDNAGGETYTLYDRETDTLTIVNEAEQTYNVMDDETMDRMSGQMSQAMKEMQKQLEQMPPEQREMMEKMMGGAGDMGKSMMEMSVDRTGRKMDKAGYDCRQVFVSVGKLARQELCVVDPDEIDMSDSDRETLDAMQERMRTFAEKMSQGMGVNLVVDFESIGGMPVYMKQDRERTGQVLKEVAHGDIDESELTVPESYTEEEIRISGE